MFERIRRSRSFTAWLKTTLCIVVAVFAAQSPAWPQSGPAPSTADFAFLIGEWDVTAIQSPGSPRELSDSGVRSCAYALGSSYVRCETVVHRSNGSVRTTISLHNYNSVYGHHESLYYFSNWPVKPIAVSTLEKKEGAVHWRNEFEFSIQENRVEFIRAEFRLVDCRVEYEEYLRTSDDAEGAWRHNYSERAAKRGCD